MKLLLVNFVMDERSPVLAWQQGVATRLAARCERVVVLTERVVASPLPANVEVHRVPRILTTPLRMLGARWLMNIPVWRWCARERFDAVFVHMNADWVYRLAPCWRRFGVPVLLWYAHGTVTPRLRRAHEHASCVITSTPEGFRIPSPKVRIIGQGVDTDLFVPPASRPENATIVAVGRVSRRKRVDLMLDALAWLKAHAPQHPFRLRIIGPTLTRDDERYAAELQQKVADDGLRDAVTFEGPLPVAELPRIYDSSFLHLNLSETGSMDKAILESLASGCPTLTSNEAAFAVLRDFPGLQVRQRDAEAIGAQIRRLYEERDAFSPAALRQLVEGRHDLNSYADRVCSILAELVTRKAA
ncbi:MAG TPA: glycosyltransferase family 4 protein [Vicinamibacterales bacterium]|nr:glycosyltransferase family 4 protein [Vicinamibacterales bacterium]